MVVKMMRWPWPPPVSKKYQVKLMVHRVEGIDDGAEKDHGGVAVEIRWKGPPRISLGSFRRTVRRNCTREEVVKRGQNDCVLVAWDEEFRNVCTLSGYKDDAFHPWEIKFTVFHGSNQGAKNKCLILGSGALNIAEYACKTEQHAIEVRIPLSISDVADEHRLSLFISLGLLELRGAQVQPNTELVQSPLLPALSPQASSENPNIEKDEISAIKAGLRKVKILTEYVSTRRSRKAIQEEDGSEGRYFSKSEGDDYAYPSDSDSTDEFEGGVSDEAKDNSAARKSFSYGTLPHANYAGVVCYSTSGINDENGAWIYYSNRRSDAICSQEPDSVPTAAEQSPIRNSKLNILPWRKRKLSFRASKAKGEPLLKKAYGEEGGDDIDFDRRQLSSDESPFPGQNKSDDSNANRTSVSDFGEDSFAVGTWEQKEITSRDGQMKMQTQVFFASIDQRSEQAAGESACTALVAVIADWLQNNPDLMPIKSQFDSLIRDGSLEWRNLCDNEVYRERFPDKHFDLDTVLQAKIRDLCVIPGKSFIGFFHPDGMEEGNFDFLHGAMSLDNIWDEVSRLESSKSGESPVFIVSWNDHFFILKVETDAYYIIDTLGERLHEGCNQAYILKFDRNTTVYNLPNTDQTSEEEPTSEQTNKSNEDTKETQSEEAETVVCQGKESCKEYIKNFLAAIPIRELQADMKKGLTMSAPLHHRLQIEFHFTHLQPSPTALPKG